MYCSYCTASYDINIWPHTPHIRESKLQNYSGKVKVLAMGFKESPGRWSRGRLPRIHWFSLAHRSSIGIGFFLARNYSIIAFRFLPSHNKSEIPILVAANAYRRTQDVKTGHISLINSGLLFNWKLRMRHILYCIAKRKNSILKHITLHLRQENWTSCCS